MAKITVPATFDPIDDAIDAAWDSVRGHPVTDRLFYSASEAANFSMIWHGLAVTRAIVLRDWRLAARTSAALGIESALVNVVGGFGGWFSLGPRPVKTWKQAAGVLPALYPTVLVLNELFDWLLPEDVPYLLAVLVGNIAGVTVLSWILMPRLTSWLDGWLRR